MPELVLPHRTGQNVEDLHPIFVRRLHALIQAVPGLYVYSGVRTYEHQLRLYQIYLNGGTLAANPDKVMGTRTIFGETFVAKGSWHMVQSTGFGYAADMQPDENIPFSLVPWHSDYTRWFRPAPAPFGLTRTVQPRLRRSKWEPWHLQPLPNVTTIYDNPQPEPTLNPLEEDMGYIRLASGATAWTPDLVSKFLLRTPAEAAEHRAIAEKLAGRKLPDSATVTSEFWKKLRTINP